MGVSMRSTVRNAARLAVYDEMIMRVKNHQAEPTIRPDTDLYTCIYTSAVVELQKSMWGDCALST